MFTSRIAGISSRLATQIFGLNDQNLRELRDRHEVEILYRDGEIRVSGESAEVIAATKTLEELRREAERNGSVTMFTGHDGSSSALGVRDAASVAATIDIVQGGKEVRPKTPGQQIYADAIRDHDIVFAMGPAVGRRASSEEGPGREPTGTVARAGAPRIIATTAPRKPAS